MCWLEGTCDKLWLSGGSRCGQLLVWKGWEEGELAVEGVRIAAEPVERVINCGERRVAAAVSSWVAIVDCHSLTVQRRLITNDLNIKPMMPPLLLLAPTNSPQSLHLARINSGTARISFFVLPELAEGKGAVTHPVWQFTNTSLDSVIWADFIGCLLAVINKSGELRIMAMAFCHEVLSQTLVLREHSLTTPKIHAKTSSKIEAR